MSDFSTNYIREDHTLGEALEILNTISDEMPERPLTLLIHDNEDRLKGTLTDGDIRRKLVSGTKLTDTIKTCMNTDFTFIRKNGVHYHDISKYKFLGIRLLPILDKDNRIHRIYDLTKLRAILPVDTVIMAGGLGTRLRPLTNDIPKPLLEIGEKPIIEHNIDRLLSYGIDHFTISVRYLGDQIVDYFGNGHSKDASIKYVHEDQPLGTAGSLSLIDEFHSDTILLSNSDVLTTLNYEDFYTDFVNNEADISVVTIPYRVKIPYGVIELDQENITAIKEKPQYTYYANAGIYLLKRSLIDEIAKNEPLEITDFIEKQIAKGKSVRTFPFWGYWLDIGKPEDFENAQKAIQILESY